MFASSYVIDRWMTAYIGRPTWMFDVGVVITLPSAVMRFELFDPENMTSNPMFRRSSNWAWSLYSHPMFWTPPMFAKKLLTPADGATGCVTSASFVRFL